jgi:hypothetical protein
MPLERVVVLVALIASLSCSAWCVRAMIRELGQAQEKRGGFSFLLLFGGVFFLLEKHSRLVPDPRTRILFAALLPLNFLLFLAYFVLRRG